MKNDCQNFFDEIHTQKIVKIFLLNKKLACKFVRLPSWNRELFFKNSKSIFSGFFRYLNAKNLLCDKIR